MTTQVLLALLLAFFLAGPSVLANIEPALVTAGNSTRADKTQAMSSSVTHELDSFELEIMEKLAEISTSISILQRSSQAPNEAPWWGVFVLFNATFLVAWFLVPHTARGQFISNFYTLLTDIGRSLSAVWGSITLDKLHEVVAYLIILFLLPNFPLVQQLLAKAVKIG